MAATVVAATVVTRQTLLLDQRLVEKCPLIHLASMRAVLCGLGELILPWNPVLMCVGNRSKCEVISKEARPHATQWAVIGGQGGVSLIPPCNPKCHISKCPSCYSEPGNPKKITKNPQIVFEKSTNTPKYTQKPTNTHV
jgi:hypothetical protein